MPEVLFPPPVSQAESRRYTPQTLQAELERLSGRRVLLYLNNNRTRMVSVRRLNPSQLEVRLQMRFLDASPEVVGELADFLANRPSPGLTLNRFLQAAGTPPPSRTPGEAGLGEGIHHDLELYRKDLNHLYLNDRSQAGVTWGRKNRRPSRRSIRFACYDHSRNLIIMNRRLDSAAVPRYFIEYVLFHEMLHEMLGIGERADGRRDIHGPVFKLMESTFPDVAKALRFEAEFVKHLDEF